jgi:hypothetical protein
MVQITLAFVIILGYLISKGMVESQDLAAEADSQRQRNVALESIVADLGSSELGQERAKRIQAQRDLQFQRLLNAWWKVRTEREFFTLLNQFNNAELITLSDDLASLPIEPGFHKLNTEIDRIFFSGTDKVSPEEITRLMTAVVKAAGYDPGAKSDQGESQQLTPEERALYGNPNIVTEDNLRMLTSQIIGDLNQERNDLVEIQYALVGKIAAARRDKLAALPLGSKTDIDVNTPDLARVMLERILSDLRNEVRLLPETADRIRAASHATVTDVQE